MMFENLATTQTTNTHPSVVAYTETSRELKPGEYWIGDIQHLFAPTSTLPNLGDMVLETIKEVGDTYEPYFSGMVVTHNEKEIPFMVNTPTFPEEMYVRVSDDTIIETTGVMFDVDTHMVMMPVTDVTVPDNKVRQHLYDTGVFLTFTEPVSVSNAVCLHFFNQGGTRIVTEIL